MENLKKVMPGTTMYKHVEELFPICRSITGSGVRQTLNYLSRLLPGLEIHAVPSGTQVFDWTVPDEWNVRDAYVADEQGNRVIDFRSNNLHLVGYSEPIDIWVDREVLETHLYSLPNQPNAIPYVTSYYSKRWGFCLTHKQRLSLPDGKYHVVIDSDLKPGSLTYGELILPGDSEKEVLLSTYICHPSMANNELSGPVVTAALAQWLTHINRNYTYRVIFIPETIGSITYLSQNLEYLKDHTIAGFNITCIGDDRCYSYLPSRDGNTLSDFAALHVLKHTDPKFISYTWLNRGSDERQYCAPGIDLPIATIMRSKYGEYPEYHTSLDNLSLVTPKGLEGGFLALKRAIEVIEHNYYLEVTVLGEPQLGKRGLYPTISTKDSASEVQAMMNLITYCDGNKTLLEIADLINEPFWELIPIVTKLVEQELLKQNHQKTRDI